MTQISLGTDVPRAQSRDSEITAHEVDFVDGSSGARPISNEFPIKDKASV